MEEPIQLPVVQMSDRRIEKLKQERKKLEQELAQATADRKIEMKMSGAVLKRFQSEIDQLTSQIVSQITRRDS